MKTTLKRILEITILITLVSTLTFAQGNRGQQGQRGQQGPPQPPTDEQIEQMVEEMAEAISLTEIQQQQMIGLYTEHFDDMRKTMESGSRQDRNTMETQKKEFEAQIKKLLTKEQQVLFEEYQKNHQPQQQGMQGQRGQQRQRR